MTTSINSVWDSVCYSAWASFKKGSLAEVFNSVYCVACSSVSDSVEDVIEDVVDDCVQLSVCGSILQLSRDYFE